MGRVVFELWEHLFPSTVANFVAIVKGSARGSSGKLLSYRVGWSCPMSSLNNNGISVQDTSQSVTSAASLHYDIYA